MTVNIEKPTAVAFGNFDGVHLGHSFLLRHMLNIAEAKNLVPIAFTFAPSPRKYYGHDVPMISTPAQKAALLERLGVENCLWTNFDDKFAVLTPEMFMRDYVERRLNAKAVIVGNDFRFGIGREGNVDMLRDYCEAKGIECHIMPRICLGGMNISSTLIRSLVAGGEVSQVPQYLGRYYSCVGEVVRGDGRGSRIGFPTANLKLFSELMPQDGVYAGFLYIDGEKYTTMIYVGTRPTVNTKGERRFEIHVLDLNNRKDLYGQVPEVYIVRKIRESVKFDGMEDLRNQIDRDKALVQAMFGG